jgi:hypothetical protein
VREGGGGGEGGGGAEVSSEAGAREGVLQVAEPEHVPDLGGILFQKEKRRTRKPELLSMTFSSAGVGLIPGEEDLGWNSVDCVYCVFEVQRHRTS